MSDRALSPSALVAFLLDLAKRGFDGSFELGGRNFVLTGGEVVDVGAAEGDESIAQFLVDSGRLSGERALALEVEADGDASALMRLLTEAIGRREVVVAAQRATWLDRLIRALKASGVEESTPRVSHGVPRGHSTEMRLEFAPLVLDALARRAGEREAGAVGARASEHFALTPRAAPELASRWAGFTLPTSPTPVFKLLAQTPSAAARIAALVRAGWGRIGTPEDLKRASRSESHDQARDQANAQAQGGASSGALAASPPRVTTTELPAATFRLDDPIEPHEAALRGLVEAGAAPAEVSAAWRRVGHLWETELFAVEEAARAYREAAAVDPADFTSLSGAARLCRALGRHDLSRAYAEAALTIAEGADVDDALHSVILARLRTGDDVAAVDALASLAHRRGNDADLFERLARQRARAGDLDGAVESGLHALRVFRNRRPERARYLAEWLVSIAPDRDDLLVLQADLLSLEGFGRASTAILTVAALETTSADDRRARLSAAAERAELERRSDLAADLLSRAFDDEPGLDILHEPLAAVSAVGNTPEAHAVVLESLALSVMDDRAPRLLEAAAAFADLPQGREHALELATHALIEDPSSEEAKRLAGALARDEETLRGVEERAAAGQRELPRDALRARLARGDDEAAPAGLSLSGLAALAGDLAESCDAALAVLELDSRNPLAIARAERASRRLADTARMERAFDAALRAGPGTRERSRLLVHLSVLASARGDEITSVNRALEAIRVDPTCAEAYILLTRRLEHIPSDGLGGVVDRARAALGDSALVLRRAIEIATARGLDKLALRLREARAHMTDLAGDALRARLSLAAFSHDPAAPRAAIREALDVPDLIEEALDEALAALERLLEIDPKHAARLAIAAVDRHGEGSFVPLALRASEEAGDHARTIAALERAAAWGHGAAKARALTEIASLHRSAGSIPGEHRALLRHLSVAPRDGETLARLATLYASTGEADRLEAVLSLAVESSEDHTTRAARTVQLARARLARGRPADAIAAIQRLLEDTRQGGAGSALPLEALPFASEALAVFEVAASELADEAAVHAFFEALEADAMGRHARHGLVVRRAKLLEKIGRYEAALVHYGRALSMEPVRGGLLESIERLADALGDELAVAEAWLLLASRADADGRVAYVTGAAEKLVSAGDVTRACDEVLALYESTNRLDVLPRLFALAEECGPDRRDEIVELVVRKLEDRIDGSWDFGDQLRCLGRMIDAELTRARPEAASAAANRASELSKAEDDADQGELAALHARLAAHFDEARDEERALHHATRALEHRPDEPSALALVERLGPPADAAEARPPTNLPPLPAYRPGAARPSSVEPRGPGPKMDVAQARELVSALLTDPAQPAIWLVLSEADDGGTGVREVAAAIRAAFEHEPPPVERPFESPCPIELPYYEEREAIVEALLRTLERTVVPLIPRTVEELGADRAASVSPDDPRPAARAFFALAERGGRDDLELYFVDDIGRVGQVTTDPAGVVVSAWAARDAAKLPFRLARLVALAAPGALLVGSRLSTDELRVVFDAVSLAFSGQSPAEETRADVASLATRLRRELSPETQDEIAAWLYESPLPSAEEVREMVERRAAGLALLGTGTLNAAIHALFLEDPALVAQPPRGLESLYSACKSSRALADLLTLALDPAFSAMYRENALAQG